MATEVRYLIIQTKKGDVATPRSTIWDRKLSDGAFRLLMLMLERDEAKTRAGETWKHYLTGYATMLKDFAGKGHSLRNVHRYAAELKKAGYLTMTKIRGASRQMGGTAWEIRPCKATEMAARLVGVPPEDFRRA